MLLDTNILVRHLTGEPAEQAARATAFLRDAAHLELGALIVAELVDLLESVYERTRPQVAALARAVLAHPPVLAAESPTGVGSSGPVLELPRLTFHGLRRCHACLLLDQGVPITVVSERLGQANVMMTMNVYAHVLPAQDQAAAAAIGRALAGGPDHQPP